MMFLTATEMLFCPSSAKERGGGYGPGFGDFMCKLQVPGKHPLDSKVFWHVPAKERKM